MALRPAVNNLVKHELLFTCQGELCMNTIWTTRSATADYAVRIAAERAVIRTFLTTKWAPNTAASAQLDLIKSWDFSVSPPQQYAGNPGVIPWTLTGGGVKGLPASITIAIALRTEAVGSSIRGLNGRIFQVGVHTQAYDGNYLQGGYPAVFIANWTFLRDTLKESASADGRGTWCVVSFTAGGARGAPVFRPAPVVKVVDHILLNSRLAIQRRRRARENSFTLGT